jgi:uncharacterized RDD family membrane protein YckC
MEDRNPYAPPKARLSDDGHPSEQLSVDAEAFEYCGFWSRCGAGFLDGLIMLPLSISLFVMLSFTRNAYLYYFVPSIAISLFYYAYLVRRFGATPGKRILGMRIAMSDGNPVTLRAAMLRFSPMLAFTVLSGFAMILATFSLGETNFDSLGLLEKIQLLDQRAPKWNSRLTFVILLWLLAGAIVLLANKRKRAVHDFLAGTIVLRDAGRKP